MRGRLLLLVAALFACGDLGFESRVDDKEEFDPPEVYRTWWGATEACSRHSGSYEAIDWYLASGIVGDGLVARGRWSPPHEIVIVRGYEADEKTVRHEMLHDLLGGDPEHTSTEWSVCDLLFS